MALAGVAWPCGCAGPQRAVTADGRKPITLDSVYGAQAVNFSGEFERGLQWLPDGKHFLKARKGVLRRFDTVTGRSTPAYDVKAFRQALIANGKFNSRAAKLLSRHPMLFSKDRSAALLEHDRRLYLYRFEKAALEELGAETVNRREISLSPDCGYVAYVRDNDLYAVSTATGKTTRLTQDGSATMLNGVFDWVYWEELYNHNRRAYWWSEDGQYLAYLQSDEHDVPSFPVVDYLPTHGRLSQEHYPKAGDPNPVVRLGVVSPEGGETTWVDLKDYDQTDLIIPWVGWSPDHRVVFAVQDREQRWLELNDADPKTGRVRTLLSETSPAWVDFGSPPYWLADGAFLWVSARDGWPHLYLYRRDGKLMRRLTNGRWEVRRCHGVDAAGGWVYFSGTCDSPVETHAYRVSLAGGPVERLTAPGFTHNADFDPGFSYFIDTFSNLTTPPKVEVRQSDGALVRVLSENEVKTLGEYIISPPRIVRFATPAGYDLNAIIIKPPNADPRKKYPVFCPVYGGPHMSMVHNSWNWEFGWQQWLAQQGVIVWICDPHSASGEGAVSAWQCYQRLGVTELQDLEAGLRWLGEHENADLQRVGIYGHSYGGFMTAFTLTHSTMFKMGLAASSVTDWRNYDSIYTERYMRTPQNNPDGYKASSVVEAAGQLHGRLLLIHGAMDDNVHMQNSVQFIDALERAEKPFELMILPRDMHGFGNYREFWRRLKDGFIKDNL